MKDIKGITLISLSVTIIVILILSGVGISFILGDNGLINKTNDAKNKKIYCTLEEKVNLAIHALYIEYMADISKITPELIAEELKRSEKRNDILAEQNIFPTNIFFKQENIKIPVKMDIENGKTNLDGMYSIAINEADIAPVEIFEYEIKDKMGKPIIVDSHYKANPGEANPNLNEVKIVGIKKEYCYGNFIEKSYFDYFGYYNLYFEKQKNDYKGIDPNAIKTLIVPYRVKLDGKYYNITSVALNCWAKYKDGANHPSKDNSLEDNAHVVPGVETIIYPNCVKYIENVSSNKYLGNSVSSVKKIILPNSLERISDNILLERWENLKELKMFKGNNFYKTLDGILYSGDGKKIICSPNNLEGNIKISEGVEEVLFGRFGENSISLKNVTEIYLPSTIKKIINEKSFDYNECPNLKSVIINKKEGSLLGAPWGASDKVTIKWIGN